MVTGNIALGHGFDTQISINFSISTCQSTAQLVAPEQLWLNSLAHRRCDIFCLSFALNAAKKTDGLIRMWFVGAFQRSGETGANSHLLRGRIARPAVSASAYRRSSAGGGETTLGQVSNKQAGLAIACSHRQRHISLQNAQIPVTMRGVTLLPHI